MSSDNNSSDGVIKEKINVTNKAESENNDKILANEGFIRAHLFMSGKVQGVYFRQNTKQVAIENGVNGWVRNLPDGRVEAVVEGKQMAVSKVVEWCHRGAPPAQVKDVQLKYETFTGSYDKFSIVS